MRLSLKSTEATVCATTVSLPSAVVPATPVTLTVTATVVDTVSLPTAVVPTTPVTATVIAGSTVAVPTDAVPSVSTALLTEIESTDKV